MLGILGAIEAEVALVREALIAPRCESRLGIDVWTGELDGTCVALARCGVGKVNGALGVVALHLAGADQIVFSGVAGGVAPGLRIGDIVVASELVQHDVDAVGLGLEVGHLPGEPRTWSCDEALVRDLQEAAVLVAGDDRVHRGPVASGDEFVSSRERATWIHEQFGALCAEMEGAAAGQAAAALQIPVAVVRSLSDSADEQADADFSAFLDMASRRGLELVRALVAARAAQVSGVERRVGAGD